MKKLTLAACLILAGCQTLFESKVPLPGSYVAAEITASDSLIVAKDMVGFLANQFAYAKTTIALDPIRTEFDRIFAEELGKRGFGVIEGNPIPGSVEVYYAVSVLDNGVVARMRFQGKEASRFYTLTEQGLQLGGRYALRGAFK